MAETVQGTGQCLCKAVTIEAEHVERQFEACHCDMCRNWGGGPFLATDCGTDVKISGEEHVTAYDSSDWGRRGFCSRCGTHLFYQLKHNGQYIMPIGLFGNIDDFVFHQQIFIDSKPAAYCFANDTKKLTGEEVFAQFGNQ